jgi:voltage-gated potassium channel
MEKQNKLDLLTLVIIILTIYVLGALIVDTFWVLPPETSRLLSLFDYVICAFFFIEFSYPFIQSDNKKRFMRWGWIDLFSNVPMIDYLRAGRLLRLIRLLRIIRAFRSTNQLVNHIFANKAKGALTSVLILAILLIIFSSIAILEVENQPNSNIKTAEDAIWWAYTTIKTVGYGDKYPVTTERGIIAMTLMTFGVGLFGTFTAYIASIFVKDK